MMQYKFLCGLVGMSLVFVGCAKKEDSGARAARAVAGLMPGGDPKFEVAYVEDQSQKKTLPARELKYDSLETFRTGRQEAPAEAASEDGGDAKAGEASEDGGDDKEAAAKAKPKDKKGGLLKMLGDKVKSIGKGAKQETPKSAVKKTEPAKKAKEKPSMEGAGGIQPKAKSDEKADAGAEKEPSEEAANENAEEGQQQEEEQPAAEEGETSSENERDAESGETGETENQGEANEGEEKKPDDGGG